MNRLSDTPQPLARQASGFTQSGQRSTSATARTSSAYMAGLIEDSSMVVDILSFMHHARRTGALDVVAGTVRKTIYVRSGSVIAASSTQPEDRLGHVVYRMGLITRMQLEDALKSVGSGVKIGNVLLERGLLSPRELWQAIRNQIEEILYSALMVEAGRFQISKFDPALVPNLNALNTQQLLLEGLRRKDEMAHLKAAMPGDEQVLATTGRSGAVTLNDAERRVIHLVDGQKSVFDIQEASGLGQLTTMRAIQHLLKMGLLERAPTQPAAPPQQAAPVEPAPQTFELDTASGPSTPAEALIGAYNDAFADICGALLAHMSPDRLARALSGFFQDPRHKTDPVLEGIRPLRDGRLPSQGLLDNLRRHQTRDPLRSLRQALHEHLQFLLFLARESLAYHEVERLSRLARDRVRDLTR